MKSRNKFSRRLKKRRRRLLDAYRDRDLHRLRITLRRMRSLLKLHSGKKAKNLRRELGMLADTTNAARDLDTLLSLARDFLPENDYVILAQVLSTHEEEAHSTVLRMLRSPAWSGAIERWDQYMAQDHPARRTGDAVSREGLAEVLQRVCAAREKALQRDTGKRWHRLRIAVKDLRYRLDEFPPEERAPGDSELLELCKHLQEELGDWHDTVVHRELLADVSSGGAVPDESEAGEVVNRLYRAYETRGREDLVSIKKTLQKQATLRILSPAAHGL